MNKYKVTVEGDEGCYVYPNIRASRTLTAAHHALKSYTKDFGDSKLHDCHVHVRFLGKIPKEVLQQEKEERHKKWLQENAGSGSP